MINFSEPVSPSGSWFTINCANSGSHTAAVSSNAGSYQFTLNPNTDFGSVESCTVTVVGAQVSDLDTFDPPDTMAANHVFSFTTADASVCGDPATPIHTVQGSGAASPIAGSSVAIEGVVVGDYQAAGEFGGFYVQEEALADADPATSEGIFVFSTLANVSVGDRVRVRGTVTEFASGTSSLTELTSVNVVSVCSTGNPVTADDSDAARRRDERLRALRGDARALLADAHRERDVHARHGSARYASPRAAASTPRPRWRRPVRRRSRRRT